MFKVSSLSLEYFTQPSKGSTYRDRKYEGGVEEFEGNLKNSSTLYVGNLSFFTSEEQIFSLFSKCGPIKRVIMGLDRNKKTPCGFAFIEYYERESALKSKSFLDGMKLDERFIRVDLDAGFKEGRQFGRGKGGGQVRDEFRVDYDPGRGGWGGSAQEPQSKKKRY
jgi:nuclear cap-binding protein subunit 2